VPKCTAAASKGFLININARLESRRPSLFKFWSTVVHANVKHFIFWIAVLAGGALVFEYLRREREHRELRKSGRSLISELFKQYLQGC
jgi:hypothetical protein